VLSPLPLPLLAFAPRSGFKSIGKPVERERMEKVFNYMPYDYLSLLLFRPALNFRATLMMVGHLSEEKDRRERACCSPGHLFLNLSSLLFFLKSGGFPLERCGKPWKKN